MATLVIRGLNDRTHARLRGRAAQHGRSVEAEVRAILTAAVERPARSVLMSLHESFNDGGIDLDVPQRADGPREVDLL